MAQVKDLIHDERIIIAFLNNYRMIDVMNETGLSKKTVYRIRSDPEFQRIVRERKTAIIETAVNKMQSYLTKDVEILQKIIEDPKTSPQVKINAIQTLMSQLREWTTTADIMKQLQELQNTSGHSQTTFRGCNGENIG